MFDLNPDKLILFAFAVTPGVIAAQTYSLWSPVRRDWGNAIAEVVTCSLVCFGFWFWLVIPRANREYVLANPFSAFVVFAIVCVIFPAGLATGWYFARKKWLHKLGMAHPTRTAWDHMLKQNGRFYALCHLRDGRKIAGLFWGLDSFGSLGPEEQDIFCEIQYTVIEVEGQPDKIGGAVADSLGFYVKAKDCQHIELFRVPENSNEQQAKPDASESLDKPGTP